MRHDTYTPRHGHGAAPGRLAVLDESDAAALARTSANGWTHYRDLPGVVLTGPALAHHRGRIGLTMVRPTTDGGFAVILWLGTGQAKIVGRFDTVGRAIAFSHHAHD